MFITSIKKIIERYNKLVVDYNEYADIHDKMKADAIEKYGSEDDIPNKVQKEIANVGNLRFYTNKTRSALRAILIKEAPDLEIPKGLDDKGRFKTIAFKEEKE